VPGTRKKDKRKLGLSCHHREKEERKGKDKIASSGLKILLAFRIQYMEFCNNKKTKATFVIFAPWESLRLRRQRKIYFRSPPQSIHDSSYDKGHACSSF